MALKKDVKKKAGQREKNKRAGVSIRRFIITYLLLMTAFFNAAWIKPIHRVVDINEVYTRSVVVVTSKILGLLGVLHTHRGSIIALPTMSFDVNFGCNGLEAVMIYSIAVIAYPADWKRKLAGIAAGFFILQAANILRILSLIYSGIHLKSLFDFIHVYIAQGIMIALALGIFFKYLSHVKKAETVSN